jgi:hypothetical protein
MRKSFHERRDLIVSLLNHVPGITCKTPGGAFYAWPNVTEACRMTGCADSENSASVCCTRPASRSLADIHFGSRVPDEGSTSASATPPRPMRSGPGSRGSRSSSPKG